MTDNYYEIKILRLKILYILAGWAVFIFAWICFSNIFHEFLFEDPVVRILLEQIHLREESFTISFIAMATLLLLYILIFSDWIRLRFWETWGLSIVFIIMAPLSCEAFLLLNSEETLLYSLMNFLYGSAIIWGIPSIYQILIFLPIFTIGYHIRVSWLKRRKSYTRLSRKTRVCLYLLNLFLFFNIGHLIIWLSYLIIYD